MNGQLVLKLQDIINQSPKSNHINQTIAFYLLNNLYDTDMTIAKIAENCHVSNASVTRFAQDLGYEGFNSLKTDYFVVQMEKHELRIDLNATAKDEAAAAKQTESLKEEFSEMSAVLTDFNDNLDFEEIKNLCQLIHDSNEVHIYSTLIPGNISSMLQHMLLTAGKTVKYHPTITDQITAAEDLAKKDLAIFISLEGSYIINRELTLPVLQSDAPNVIITQNPEMKLGTLFDHMISLGNHDRERYGKYKLMMFVEYLAHFYFQMYGQ